MEERKGTTTQQSSMLHMRTRPGNPGTALGWGAHAFPWIFPSLLPPALLSLLHPAPPLSGFSQQREVEVPTSHGTWHHDGSLSQAPGLSLLSTPGSIKPKPPQSHRPWLQHPSTQSCTSCCLHSTRNPARPAHRRLLVPLPASCHPAPCHHLKSQPLPLRIPPVP